MTDMVLQKNIAALITPRTASAFTALTAGGAGNAVAVTGLTFQRSLVGLPESAAIELFFTATLTAAKTLSIGTVKIQDSADGTTFADFQTFTDPGVVATGAGTVIGQMQLQATLAGARDYVRVLFTPTLSNTATDTAIVLAALILSGFRILPAPT